MRESILTIPVNDVFESDEGCPFCRMRDEVEAHVCEYITGAAMMEPDVRMETNALGFCHTHFLQLLKQNNRLSVGLMLNSHLEKLRAETFGKKSVLPLPKKKPPPVETCFVCSKTEWGMNHMVKTVFTMFRDDAKFKNAFKSREYICMPHYRWLLSKCEEQLPKSERAAFTAALDELVSAYAAKLNADIDEFCDSFDYRNAGKLHSPEMEHVRTSVARAIGFLTGRLPE